MGNNRLVGIGAEFRFLSARLNSIGAHKKIYLYPENTNPSVHPPKRGKGEKERKNF